jgi:RNA polymerase sigma factor (sigma-70 family)
MKSVSNKGYSDQEIVDGLIGGKEKIVEYFFFEQCGPMLHYIVKEVFDNRADASELVSELYLFLQEEDWKKLRQFRYQCKLMSWLTMVAVRFFVKKRNMLIEGESNDALLNSKAVTEISSGSEERGTSISMDINDALRRMKNKRYSEVIRLLIMEDREPQEVADLLKVTVENLYNMKRRALKELVALMNDRH